MGGDSARLFPSAMTMAPRLACRIEAQLGEGPVWLPEEQALWFVDIKAGRIHRFDPESGTCDTLEVGGRPSFVLPVAGGGMIAGSGSSLYRLEDGVLGARLLRLDMPGHNRTNDATVDSAGRLWFGTMDDEERRPSGELYCLDRGRLTQSGWRAAVTNGPAVTEDARFLYHVSSSERIVWRIPLEHGACAKSGEPFIHLNDDEGFPDGVVLDAEGCLWVALWDGWGVRRYAQNGRLLLHVTFPCSRVTKVAFGGPDLRSVYVTTARAGLDEAELARQPLAGGLFVFDAPAPGLVMPRVRLQ